MRMERYDVQVGIFGELPPCRVWLSSCIRPDPFAVMKTMSWVEGLGKRVLDTSILVDEDRKCDLRINGASLAPQLYPSRFIERKATGKKGVVMTD